MFFRCLFVEESAKTRSILNDMILEAHEIRENQTYRQTAINQAKQLQNQDEEIDDDLQQLNSRTIKEFPEDAGTLVPGRDLLDDGTMIAHEDCGTLVPDSGTMVELQSNLGTMVINSDSEDATMKSVLTCLCKWSKVKFTTSCTFFAPSRTRHQSGQAQVPATIPRSL